MSAENTHRCHCLPYITVITLLGTSGQEAISKKCTFKCRNRAFIERAEGQSQLSVAAAQQRPGRLQGYGIGGQAQQVRAEREKARVPPRASLEAAVLERIDQRHDVAGTRLATTETTPSAPPPASAGSGCRRPKEPSDPSGRSVADLVERAGRFLDRHDRAQLGQPLDGLGLDVPAGPAGNVVKHQRQIDAPRRWPRNGGTCPPGWAGCNRGPPAAHHRRRPGRRTGSGGWPRPSSWSPVPGITRALPAAVSTTSAMTRSCSSCESVGDSPVVPTGLIVGVPAPMCHSTRASRAASSTAPSRNGVTRATVQPANI